MSRRLEGLNARDVLRRLAREPLVHFLILGAVLFAAIGIMRELRRPTIRLDAQELNQLASYWELQMQRPPTKAELAGLIQDRIDEELMAREALRLGLDKDDMIVRRRLAQKMAFASEDLAAAKEPSEAELRSFYAATRAQYAQPARLALRQVFFSRDRIGESADHAAALARAELAGGRAAAGDPSLLPSSYADVSLDELSRDFGKEFAAAASGAAIGEWTGPIASPYGLHLLMVESRREQEVPAFHVVRAEVREAWLAEARRKANRAYLDRLRARYRVHIAKP